MEFARNQSLAKRTWEGFFSKIVYLGEREPELTSQKTEFIPSEQWPTIKALAEVAAKRSGVTAIMNADILVNGKLRVVENRILNGTSSCGSSRRWHFDRKHLPSLDKAELLDTDRGRDIFVASQVVWGRVARDIPGYLRIGHQKWDAWMTDFFNTLKPGFIDFTHMRCIFHPKHEDRQMPFAEMIAKS